MRCLEEEALSGRRLQCWSRVVKEKASVGVLKSAATRKKLVCLSSVVVIDLRKVLQAE